MNQIRIVLLVLLVITQFSNARADSQFLNMTDHYQREMQSPSPVSDELKNVKVLLIEGVMGNYVDTVGKWFMRLFNQYDYFEDQKRWLKSVKADYKQIKIETENGSEKNAITIEKEILKSDKPVLLLTHSKGGMDALTALVRNPSLSSRVAGMISIQCPFWGTPVADYIHTTQPWSSLAHFILTLMGGSGESVKDLSTTKRLKWYEENQERVDHVLKTLPIIAFSSWKEDVPGKQDTMFEFPRDLMFKNLGMTSDGLVPAHSSILPFVPYVSVEGLDHAATVVNNTYIKFDRKRFTHVMINLFFEVKNARQ